jgi:superfamily II DNA/RNA helicase
MAGELLRDPLSVEVSPRNAAAKSVKQWLIPVDKKRKSELFLHLLQENRWGQVLVFAKTRKGVDQLEQELLAIGVSADSIHGDKPQPSRLRALERFKAGEVQILVATDVAARGLDIDDLPLVVNLDLPINAEDYVHRIGRTGRAGATGEAISLVCADEVDQLAAIENLTQQLIKRVDEPDFIPDHRVPQTAVGGQVLKKPKKPKQKLIPGAGKPAGKGNIHLGRWFEEEDAKPKAKAVRKVPSFGSKPKGGKK